MGLLPISGSSVCRGQKDLTIGWEDGKHMHSLSASAVPTWKYYKGETPI